MALIKYYFSQLMFMLFQYLSIRNCVAFVDLLFLNTIIGSIDFILLKELISTAVLKVFIMTSFQYLVIELRSNFDCHVLVLVKLCFVIKLLKKVQSMDFS